MKKKQSVSFPKRFAVAFLVFGLCACLSFSLTTRATYHPDNQNIAHKLSLEIQQRIQVQSRQAASVDPSEEDRPLRLIVQFDESKYNGNMRAMIGALLNSQ